MEVAPRMDNALEIQEEEYALLVELGAETLEGMGDLHQKGVLHDVTLDVEGKSYPAHRAFLASTSGYFKALFTEEATKANEDVVKLSGISARGLELVLDYLYKQKMVLSIENVYDVLIAGKCLEMNSVVTRCGTFLLQSLSEETHVQVLALAKEFSLKEVHQAVLVSLMENWKTASKEVLENLSFEDMLLFLDGHIQCESEVEVFNIAQQWLEAAPEDRMPHVLDIMSKVRFPLMTISELDDIVQLPSFLVDEQCHHFIDEARSYQNMPASPRVLVKEVGTFVRGPPMNIAFAGGLARSHTQEDFITPYVLDFATDFRFRWISLPNLSDHMGAASVLVENNFLIACGVGYPSVGDGGVTKRCAIYDPRSHDWYPMSSMNHPRVDFPLVMYSDTMYAFGGAAQRNKPIGEVEMFRFADDKWTVVCEMPEKLSNHAACEMNGKVYVSGGVDGDGNISNKMWSFDPSSNEWLEMPSLLEKEHGHAMLPLSKNTISLVSALSGAIYNFCLETNQWSSLDLKEPDATKYHDVNVWEFTPSLCMMTWCKSPPEGGEGNPDWTTLCHTGQQMVQLPNRNGLRSPWPTRRIWAFPDGVVWRHSALLAVPWKTLSKAHVESHQEETQCRIS